MKCIVLVLAVFFFCSTSSSLSTQQSLSPPQDAFAQTKLTVGLAAEAAPSYQDKPKNLSGKYEGVVKSDQIGDIPITVMIRDEGGKLTGEIGTPQGPAAITGGSYADGKITLKFDAGGNEGTVTATIIGDKITGKWEFSGQASAVELRLSAGAAATPAAPVGGTAGSGDPISGEWDGSADAQGTGNWRLLREYPFDELSQSARNAMAAAGTKIPFTLKLKLDGDKVNGGYESAQGSGFISRFINKGSFNGGKLSFALDNTIQGVTVTFTGVVKDGKILGDFDFKGQSAGKWEATKKTQTNNTDKTTFAGIWHGDAHNDYVVDFAVDTNGKVDEVVLGLYMNVGNVRRFVSAKPETIKDNIFEIDTRHSPQEYDRYGRKNAGCVPADLRLRVSFVSSTSAEVSILSEKSSTIVVVCDVGENFPGTRMLRLPIIWSATLSGK